MKPFTPDTLPLSSINWEAHVSNIGKVQAALARYDGMLQSIVNPGLLLSPLTTQEAVLSSRIEGTQATLEEVFEYDADPDEKLGAGKQADIQEIINYRVAITHAVDKLITYPLTLNVIKEIHAMLLDSVRGRNKAPGEFRRIQNFIGMQGADIEHASYIPPSPEMLMPALDNWEKYIHMDEKDGLVQLAIVKAQFEIIHPFLDGNGRIGRILIPLFLYEKKILASPMFYLSSYLESNREEYYTRLKAISANGDWNGWIDFFLNAVFIQANANIDKVKAIMQLYDKLKYEIPVYTKSSYTIQALDTLFKTPISSASHFIQTSKIPKKSAMRILDKLSSNDTLKINKPSRGRKPGVYTFTELLNIIQ